jgi:hypothetical protein
MATVTREAQRMAGLMAFRAPRGEGALSQSIRIETNTPRLRATIRAGGPSTTVGGYDYALGIEFSTERMPARPFFWPSYRARRSAARAAIKKAMKGAVEKSWHG